MKLFRKKQTAVKFETKLFTNKTKGIALGEMARPAVHPNPQYGEAHCNRDLLYLCDGAQIWTS
jgi:hypothetical protein